MRFSNQSVLDSQILRLIARIFTYNAFILLISLFFSLETCMAETLKNTLAKVYSNNPEIDELRANARVKDEDVSKAKAGMRPTASITTYAGPNATTIRAPVNGNFNTNRFQTNSYSTIPKTATLTGKLPIFDGWKTKNSVNQAESGVFAARCALAAIENELLLKGASVYMDVLRDIAVVNLRKNNVAVIKEQLRVTRDRMEFGEVTITDVAQNEASLARSESDYAAAQAALQTSMSIYHQTVGEDPTRLESASSLENLIPKTREEAIEIAVNSHPLVMQRQHEVDAAEYAIKVAESALLPQAYLQAQANEQMDGYFYYPGSKVSTGSVYGYLNIPLYQGGSEYSSIRQAKEQLTQARIRAQIQQNKARANVIENYSKFVSSKAAVEFNLKRVKAAEIALRGVRDEAAFGQRTTWDVLNAQQTLLDSRVELVRAQRDRVVSTYAILSSIGELSVSNLNLDVEPYIPAIHFDQIKDSWVGVSTAP